MNGGWPLRGGGVQWQVNGCLKDNERHEKKHLTAMCTCTRDSEFSVFLFFSFSFPSLGANKRVGLKQCLQDSLSQWRKDFAGPRPSLGEQASCNRRHGGLVSKPENWDVKQRNLVVELYSTIWTYNILLIQNRRFSTTTALKPVSGRNFQVCLLVKVIEAADCGVRKGSFASATWTIHSPSVAPSFCPSIQTKFRDAQCHSKWRKFQIWILV